MTVAGDALGPAEIDRALASISRFDAVVLGVSGGPDSMVLMHAVAEWAQRRGKGAPRILVATVDHGLRAQSAQEADFVARCAARLGLDHRTLCWEGLKPAHGIPAAARAARYELLERAATDFARSQAVAVAVAHTRDDQAETFLMRLKRGSGVDGLAAMAPERRLSRGGTVTLLRPFLDFPKSRLTATLRARGVTWLDDPTNTNQDFERPSVRAAMTVLESLGITAGAIALSAQRLGRAQEALAFADSRVLEQVSLRIDREIFAELDATEFARMPPLLRERLLIRLIRRFGGATPEPQLSEVENLAVSLQAGGEMLATLGGAMISQGPRALRVWREAGRIAPADLILKVGEPQLWDNRFWVSAEGSTCPVRVRALGLDRVARLDLQASEVSRVPSRALAALPAFYAGEALIGVPCLSYQADAGSRLHARPAAAD